MIEIARCLFLFVVAGLAEIGGGWLMWQWLRERKPWRVGVVGGPILVFYGVLPTLQREAAFGRVYAAYDGIFIVLSLSWGWQVDGWQPDRYDMTGAAVGLAGVAIIMWERHL